MGPQFDLTATPAFGLVGWALTSSGRFRDDGSGVVLLGFAVALAAAAVGGAVYVRGRARRGAAAAITARLFDDLCRLHRLSDEERTLLARAAAGNLHTSVVFVDPRPLDRLGERHPDEAMACVKLRERLFGA